MATDLTELERRLWAAADELRANSNLTASQYRDPVLGLIFLAFAEQRFEVIEPYHGRILDPACGSGGMFVQSAKFVNRHKREAASELSIHGCELKEITVPLAKMNLALHGLEASIVEAKPALPLSFRSWPTRRPTPDRASWRSAPTCPRRTHAEAGDGCDRHQVMGVDDVFGWAELAAEAG